MFNLHSVYIFRTRLFVRYPQFFRNIKSIIGRRANPPYMKSLLNFPIFRSSIDPTQLSNTVRGIILSMSSVVIMASALLLGKEVTPQTVTAFADQVAQTIAAIGIAAGMIHTTYGLIMKVVHAIASKYAAPTINTGNNVASGISAVSASPVFPS